MRLTVMVIAVCVIAGCAPAPVDVAPPEGLLPPVTDAPNVILISLDTTRADHMSVYGYERATTPYLKKFASEGILFEKAYAPMGITGPSHATMFTGLYPIGHGVVKNGLKLADEHTTLAETLSEAGYQTVAVISSFVLDRRFGLNQGFDFYDDDIPPEEGLIKLDEWEGFALEKGFDRHGEFTINHAVSWLTQKREPDQPFFLFVHLFDPHAPYLVAGDVVDSLDPDWATRDTIGKSTSLYDAEIRSVDSQIERLMKELDALGLDEETMVVVTADHGEGLMQHGYMMHGMGVFEEEVHIPFLLRWPGHISPGVKVSAPIELTDLMPTLLSFTGTDGVDKASGRNLRGAILGLASLDSERPVFTHRRHYSYVFAQAAPPGYFPLGEEPDPVHLVGRQYAVRQGPWKLIVTHETNEHQLYNLDDDPGELKNLGGQERDVVEELQEQLDLWLENYQRPIEPNTIIQEEDLEALKALGYLE